MRKVTVRGFFLIAATCGGLVGTTESARAQAPTGDEDLPAIRLSGAGVELLKLAIPRAEGDSESARVAVETLSRDMDVTGLFQVLDPASFPSALQSEGLGFSNALWSQVGAQAVVKMRASAGQLEGRLYALARGETAMLSKTYRGSDLRDAVHDFANDIVQAFTNFRGVFGSRIAFAQVGRGSHEIASVDMDGGRMSVLTKMQSDCLLPAYSPSGGEVAFTSYLRDNPDLWIVSAGGGRARRTSKQPGMNTGAAWSPDGGSIAVTLSFQGNSELYKISPGDGTIMARLTNNPAIDSSPSFSADGGQIAFVSNRQGSPQIFVMPASGGGARRLTFQGKYNQTPRFNPDPKKAQVAFTGRDERGVFDIFFIDMKTQQVTRVTQGKGSNMDPGVVSRRAALGLRLQPWRPVRQQPRDPSRGANHPRWCGFTLVGSGPEAIADGRARDRHDRHRHQHHPASGRPATSGRTVGRTRSLGDGRRNHEARKGHRRRRAPGPRGDRANLRGACALCSGRRRARRRNDRHRNRRPCAARRTLTNFCGPRSTILGGPLEVIDGDREAALTFRAVAESFPAEIAAGRVGVVDIGGGSTEIIVADEGKVVFRRSLPLGSVRLHERHVHGDPADPRGGASDRTRCGRDAGWRRRSVHEGPLTMLVGVAGTVTSLAAMSLCLDTYDPARVHGSTLTLAELDARIASLAAMKQAERERIPGLDPRRADVIFAGALLLRAIVRRAGLMPSA